MKAPFCFRLLMAVLALGCVQAGWSAAPDSLEAEVHPVEPGIILRGHAQREMARLQESNRLRVVIPHAVRDEVKIAPSAAKLEAPLPPARPSIFEGREDYVSFGIIFILLAGLVGRDWARYRRYAETRRLCGGYLSDGTEAASYKLPDWFAPAPQREQSGLFLFGQQTRSSLEPAQPSPGDEFLAQAPERLAELRTVLRELNVSGPLEARQQVLHKAHELVSVLKDKSKGWELRPAWQISSAIELLLKRVADKPKDMTASVVRTIAAAVDVLHEVCVPGVRVNLLNDPPLKILAVDDDPLCLRALQLALEKAHFTTDLAENGEKAVELATAHAYDVVFMDLQMPGIDGLTACGQIHETDRNREVPVVFVTVQSDFNTRAQLRLKGGADLMAKPFLIFELTVKAVTFAIRKRLQASMVNRPDLFTVLSMKPVLQIGAPSEMEAGGAAKQAMAMGGEINRGETGKIGAFNPVPPAENFLADSPQFFAETREILEGLQQTHGSMDLEEQLGMLYLRVHALSTRPDLSERPVAAHMTSTLEALLKRLYRAPKMVTASTLNTIGNALRLIESLSRPGLEEKLADPAQVRMLVVDDEPLARRAVMGALQLAFKQPESAEDGSQAAMLVARTAYDVIFTDVQMPGLDGFELCAAVRNSSLNAETPVIFITNNTDVEAQAKAMAAGGNDFIGKPFLPIEITLKALTFAWEGRLRKIDSAACVATAPSLKLLPPRSETEPAAVLLAS